MNKILMNKKGFSLVELIAVMGIIALLFILLIPNVTDISNKTQISLKDSKIRTIESVSEELGNAIINNYQLCTGNDIEHLKNNCTIGLDTLVKEGYMEGDEDDKILDPTTNSALSGRVLLCYNPKEINVYAKYVEDDDSYACKEIAADSDNALSLVPSRATGFLGGDQLKASIFKVGTFLGDLTCNSNIAKCRINGSNLEITMPTIEEAASRFGDTFGPVRDTIRVTGTYINEDGEEKTMTTRFSLQLYKTSIAIKDKPETRSCLESGKEITYDLIANNAGIFTIDTNTEIIEGSTKDDKLTIATKGNTGAVDLKIGEKNGYTSDTIEFQVYRLDTDELPESMIYGTEERIAVRHSDAGNITITSDAPEYIKLKKKNGEASASIVLDSSDDEFSIVAVGKGASNITITGDLCGRIEKRIVVANLSLHDREGTIYVGGKDLTNVIETDKSDEVKCTTSNRNAATCEIIDNTLHVRPGTVADSDVTVTVESSFGEKASMKVHVLATTIETVNASDQSVRNVCTEKGSNSNSDVISIRGTNMGDVFIGAQSEYDQPNEAFPYNPNIVTASLDKSGSTIGVNLAAKDSNITGRSSVHIVESNGNQVVTLYYDIWSLSTALSESGTNTNNATLKVGETIKLYITSSAAGAITATSSDTSIATVKMQTTDNEDYDMGINAINTNVLEITGVRTGTTTVRLRGAYCGYKEITLTVLGNTLVLNLEPGTYTKALGTNQVSCTTTGSQASCNVVLPDIITEGEFEAIGYSLTKDSDKISYKAGDTIALNAEITKNILYGNSRDIKKPVCSFTDSTLNTVINKTSYFSLVCTDKGSGIANEGVLEVSDFENLNPEISEVIEVSAPTPITDGYSYKIGFQSKKIGTYSIKLKEQSVVDLYNNGNDELELNDINTSFYDATWIGRWEVGRRDPKDVVAILYDNAAIGLGEEGTQSLMFYGAGAMVGFRSETEVKGDSPWKYPYDETITNVYFEDGITNVGSATCIGFKSLKTVDIPESVMEIEDSAFESSGLTEIKIPQDVKRIGVFSFYNNFDLKTVDFNDGLQTIDREAFYNHNIKTLNIPSSVEFIGDSAFGTDVELSVLEELNFGENSNLQTIGDLAFLYHKLKTLTIPKTVTSIGEDAFYQFELYGEYSTLKTLVFEEGSVIKDIKSGAFRNTSVSGSLTLPDTLETIGEYAFAGLRDNITSFNIGPNVRELGSWFAYGSELKEFTIDEANTNFTVKDGVVYTSDFTRLIKCPDDYYKVNKELNIPTTVTEIQDGAFMGMQDYDKGIEGMTIYLPSGLKEITIENNFRDFIIGSYIIQDNELFETVDGILFNKDKTTIYRVPSAYNKTDYTIPDSVTTIDKYFAYMNTSLDSVTIPETVTSIDSLAFATDSDIALPNIYIEKTDDNLEFNNKAFDLMCYEYGKDIETISRTIYVLKGNKSLKEKIEKAYETRTYFKIKVDYYQNSFTVTFDPNEGTVDPTTKKVFIGKTYGELPTPTKEGYIFLGWFTELDGGSEITSSTTVTITSDQTLYAHWEKKASSLSEQVLEKLGITPNEGEPDYSNPATTDEGVFPKEDDYGTSYFFRGASKNNYVKYGKNKDGSDMYWRIIRINGNGTLRIIYDGTQAYANGTANDDRYAKTGQVWNTIRNDAKYVGYMFEGANGVPSTSKTGAQTNETNSEAKTAIDTWYKENILDTNYGSNVVDTIFCNDRSIPGKTATGWTADTGLGYGTNATGYGAPTRTGLWNSATVAPQPKFTCNVKNDAFTVNESDKGNGDLTYPVGLITADEILAAGSGKHNTANNQYYLYKSSSYVGWSLSPHYFIHNAFLYVVSTNGNLNGANSYHTGGAIAPVINLSFDAVMKFVGEGTMTSPYEIEEKSGASDLIAKANDETVTDYESGNKTEMFTFDHEATDQTPALRDYRYIGATPNNYIQFNDETWRIIGVFPVLNSETNEYENRIKIMKNESIGNIKRNLTETNKWVNGNMMTILNNYYNSTSISLIVDYRETIFNYTETGIKDKARSQTTSSLWHLGANDNVADGISFYKSERSSTKAGGESNLSTVQNIGLIYPSDYVYTFANGVEDTCFNNGFKCNSNTGASPKNSWIYNDIITNSLDAWTIMGCSLKYNAINIRKYYGHLVYNSDGVALATIPVLYLRPDIKLAGGDGSKDNPYLLGD